MRTQQGFTLIELVLFIVIVGIAVSAIGLQIQTSVQHSAQPLLREKGIALANFYMDEILRKKWNESSPTGGGCVQAGGIACAGGAAATAIGAEAGEVRATYDDIDDYNSLPDPTPRDQTGAALADFTNYTVAVTVNAGVTLHASVAAADTLEITVTVTTPLAETITLRAYRVNF
jgi:MSHA pilin protein MshD